MGKFHHSLESHSREEVAQQLRQGHAALKRQDYLSAANIFEPLQQAPRSADRIKAQIGLVQAYVRLNRTTAAAEICRSLSQHPSAKVRQWAAASLRTLAAPPQSPEPSLPADASGFVPLEASPPPAAPTSPQPDDSDAVKAEPASSLFHYQQLNQTVPEPANTDPQIPAARPSRLQALPTQGRWQLWIAAVLTPVAFGAAFTWLLHWSLRSLNWLLIQLQWVHWPMRIRPYHRFEDSYELWVIGGVVALIAAGPWLLDSIFQWGYGRQHLSSQRLRSHSPRALALLRRVTQRGRDPQLYVLPRPEPLCLSYGWWPGQIRIVFSQGLLERLNEQQLEALMAYELGHSPWEMPVSSGLGAGLLLLHEIYWRLASWGDRQSLPLLRLPVAIAASLSYCLYWLLRKTVLGLSRQRSRRCDRTATELLQNAHSCYQGLVALQQTTATTLQQQRQTAPLLESLDWLMPSSYQLAVGANSWVPPRWLQWNSSHPALSSRLQALEADAALLHQPPIQPVPPRQPQPDSAEVLLQGAIVLGGLGGVAIALCLWLFGGIVTLFGSSSIDWVYLDTSLLKGLGLIGAGVGMMLRINSLFPDIPRFPHTRSIPTALPSPPQVQLPVCGQPVEIRGQLLGRHGIANWLCQDIWLKHDDGLIRLHILSALGPLSNFGGHRYHPVHLLGRAVHVQGWLRRGATPWIDLMTLSHNRQIRPVSHPPIWTTLFSLGLSLWGIWIIFRGY